MTRCLAYFQYYTPKRLPKGQFLRKEHLCCLANWIGRPSPGLRNLRENGALAGHLVLLLAGGFLLEETDSCQPAMKTGRWLNQAHSEQIQKLIEIIMAARWQNIVEQLELQDTLTELYSAYLSQQLVRQLDGGPGTVRPAAWQPMHNEDQEGGWRLKLPHNLPTWILFDLLQLGSWDPNSNILHFTPLSIASFPACAYGSEHIRWLLESATQAPLPADKQQDLRQWLKRAGAYRISGSLLSTSLPEYLQLVLKNRRLRPFILEQIGPRHALVNQAIRPRLHRWLARRGYPLDQATDRPEFKEPGESSSEKAYYWLGLRLQIGLQKRLRLPYPAPADQLFNLSRTMPADMVDELELMAQQMMKQLDDADHGRDAFFPAWQCPTRSLITEIEQALSEERSITLSYQALGQREPKEHVVEPMRLDKADQLYYLVAYSYRAEANLTFRLDRIQNIG